ncbi:ABC transporter permease [Lacrimispora sp.]|uniref:ABC transporter permease n=1 Tax=Lacrimispora sp. TaxID=2719234 RepID=UPI00289B9E97|nr:ABC transporter permease [Lacrimispora sp.]
MNINKKDLNFGPLLTSVFALFFSLLLGALIIWLSGYSPIQSYAAIFGYSLGTVKGIALSLSQATPILFTGLAFAIAYRVRMINTGAEGQLYMGAVGSAVIGAYFVSLPRMFHLPLTLLAGMAMGGLAALLVAFLRVRFGASEIITSLMLNEVFILFTGYLANGPLKPDGSLQAQTEMIAMTARLHKLIPKSQLTTAILLGIILAVMTQFILKITIFGYEMNVTGLNTHAAQTAGINTSRIQLITFSLSGAVAGLCGSALVMGTNFRFVEGISPSYGFAGISVAALAAYNPVAVIPSAILFGILKAGAITLNRTTPIPVEFVDVIQVLVVVFVAAPRMVRAILEIPKRIKREA